MRTAELRTPVQNPSIVARSIIPDNTDDMHTTIEHDTLVTTITRPTTGSLRSTVDDYVVNLSVATRVNEQITAYKHTKHEHES